MKIPKKGKKFFLCQLARINLAPRDLRVIFDACA